MLYSVILFEVIPAAARSSNLLLPCYTFHNLLMPGSVLKLHKIVIECKIKVYFYGSTIISSALWSSSMIPPLGTQLDWRRSWVQFPVRPFFSLGVIFITYVRIEWRAGIRIRSGLQSVLFLLCQYHGFRGTVWPARSADTNFQWLEEQKSRY